MNLGQRFPAEKPLPNCAKPPASHNLNYHKPPLTTLGHQSDWHRNHGVPLGAASADLLSLIRRRKQANSGCGGVHEGASRLHSEVSHVIELLSTCTSSSPYILHRMGMQLPPFITIATDPQCFYRIMHFPHAQANYGLAATAVVAPSREHSAAGDSPTS